MRCQSKQSVRVQGLGRCWKTSFQLALHLRAAVQGWQGQFHTSKTGNVIKVREFNKHPQEDFFFLIDFFFSFLPNMVRKNCQMFKLKLPERVSKWVGVNDVIDFHLPN